MHLNFYCSTEENAWGIVFSTLDGDWSTGRESKAALIECKSREPTPMRFFFQSVSRRFFIAFSVGGLLAVALAVVGATFPYSGKWTTWLAFASREPYVRALFKKSLRCLSLSGRFLTPIHTRLRSNFYRLASTMHNLRCPSSELSFLKLSFSSFRLL